MITRAQIKILLDPLTNKIEQTLIINEMLNTYELYFSSEYLHETYDILKDSIKKYEAIQKNESNLFTKFDILISSVVTYFLSHTLNKNIQLHSSLLRAIYNKNFDMSYFTDMVSVYIYDCKKCAERICICEYKKMSISINIMQCPYDFDNIHTFEYLLNYGYFNFDKYCDEVTAKHLQKYYDNLNNGNNTKGIKK